MRLSGAEFNQLWAAMRDAYKRSTLEQMLYVRLEKRLDEISLGEDFKEIVYQLLQDAERNGYTMQLLAAARESNPGNSMLLEVSEQFGLSALTPALEKKIREISVPDIAVWRSRLGEIETRVCRIEGGVPLRPYGTGFLVGPGAVLTNYHVIEEFDKGLKDPASIVLRFDYKRTADGSTINAGTEFRLEPTGWLIDSRPYSSADMGPDTAVPAAEELDYGLLRVAGEPDKQPVNPSKAEPGCLAREFIRVPKTAVDLPTDGPLLIVQHPKGDPLRVGLETKSILTVNSNRTRVRYRTNTEGGSSGSPCFDIDWNLVALHHCGDPTDNPVGLARWNQGIPIDTLMSLITKRGFAGIIG
jgi:hypothetical protein